MTSKTTSANLNERIKKMHRLFCSLKSEEQVNAKPLDLIEAEKSGDFIPFPITKDNIKKKNLYLK